LALRTLDDRAVVELEEVDLGVTRERGVGADLRAGAASS